MGAISIGETSIINLVKLSFGVIHKKNNGPTHIPSRKNHHKKKLVTAYNPRNYSIQDTKKFAAEESTNQVVPEEIADW